MIKWPGGKSKLISKIEDFVPKNFERYIEPFVGGGALYFHLNFTPSVINDINENLISFYNLIKSNNKKFKNYLYLIANTWDNLDNILPIEELLVEEIKNDINIDILPKLIKSYLQKYKNSFEDIFLSKWANFEEHISRSIIDKIKKLKSKLGILIKKANKNFLEEYKEQILTAKRAGFYYFFRDIVNDISYKNKNLELYISSYIFVREYCFGSMFRYSKSGKFNIPYGGKAYNKKSFRKKVNYMFSYIVTDLLKNTEIYNLDFRDFFKNFQISDKDFLFIDPPYLSEFCNYENKHFKEKDHVDLVNILNSLKCMYLVIVEYNCFSKKIYLNLKGEKYFLKDKYTYSVRGRNNRDVTYLLILKI